MSDVNANIGVHIDTSAALAELKNLQRQLSTFHSQISKSSAAAAMAQKNLQNNLLNAVNATGQFHAQMGVVRTSTESFTNALEKNKLSMRDYFRFAGGASKSFGKLFKSEFDMIGKVAEERVKKMQTQYIKMGRDSSGAMKAMSITPNTLNIQDYGTKVAIAAQKQALLNQLLKQGSTNLLNFGKNTQWAGRQLMVGFSVPLLYIGTAAAKVFMDLEQQALKFKRVYGDMFTTTDETNNALKDIELLAKEFTKYGVAVSKTMEMAASAAAMGQTGAELTAQVAQATRLAVLGNVEQEQALATTISLTSAFGIAAQDLATKIDFLNSVENQTIVSIEDLTIAVPKAGPVVKQLGGDVEDLAFFLTAMKEGGINASEGANALKSGLAALINPTGKAKDMLNELGININKIVESNQGDIKTTVIEFAQALDTLAPLDRSRAIEQMFGKFQFARLSTLFQNITKEGTQANRVLELSQMEVEELAILSERELKTIENAVGTNFKAAVETLKLTIAPIGKTFLEAVTPVVKAVAGILEKFNGLSDGTKKFIVIASTLVGIIGPALLMAFGLIANGAANIIKLFIGLRTGFLKLGGSSKILAEQTSYMNSEQLEAATVAASLNQAHTRLTQSFTLETSAVKALRAAYVDATLAAANFARANPGMMMPGKPGKAPKKFARGSTYVPGTGNKDTVAATLTPGEAVIPAPIAQDPRFQPIIDAMVNGKLQGFHEGTVGAGFTPKQSARSAPTVTFDDREYNAKSARGATTIKNFMDGLIKNADGTLTHVDPKDPLKNTTFTKKRLSEILSKYSSRGDLSPDQIMRSLSIGSGRRGSSEGTSRPPWIKKLMAEAKLKDTTSFAEQESIKNDFKKRGIIIDDKKLNNLFGSQASHLVPEVGPDGKKIWRAANIAPEPGYINNYMNTVKGKLGTDLLKMTDGQLKGLGIDRVELKGLVDGVHPRTSGAADTLRKIADYQISTNPTSKNIYQAHAVSSGVAHRLNAGTYAGGVKSLAQLLPTNKTVLAENIMAQGSQTSNRDIKVLKEIAADAKKTKSGKLKPTNFGKLISPTSGFSFPVRDIGGMYKKPDGSNVFVKPMMDEKAALAEMRATKIAREVHGLDSPDQKIKTMVDPTDPTGKRKLIVLESAFNPKFDPTKMTNKFTKDEFFKQSVASMLRADKDLGRGNLSGNVLADVGPAGVFGSASGKRDYVLNLPSMEEQGRINLDLNTPNKNRKKFFAEATSDIARSMTPEQYDRAMKAEIEKVLPKLKETVRNFNLDPSEKPVYDAMIKRLEDGKKVNWQNLHKAHVAVPAAKLAVAKGEELETRDGKKKTVTGQTGKAKGSGRNITDKPSDTRVINKSSVRRVFPYGMKGPRVAGARGGFDGTETKGGLGFNRGLGTTTQDILKQSRVQESVLKDNIAATKDETAATKAATVETKENARQTRLSKDNIKAFGAKANIGVGAISGLTIAASFAGGKVGEMAQKIMPFVFGLQGILMLFPLLMNPLVGIPLALGAVVAGILIFKKKQDEAVKAQARLVDELFATTKKMQSVGEVFGKVGASQLAARKRESAGGDFSFERKGIKAGSAFLQSEVGKADIAAFEARFEAMPDIAMKEFSLKLASYVAEGVIDAAQAASIADQIGIEFQDKVLGIKIQGQLQGLLTSDGKDITQEPFEIRIKIAEETISQFDNLIPNLQNQLAIAEKQKKALGENLSLALTQEAAGYITGKQFDAIEQEFRNAEQKVKTIQAAIKQNSAFAAGMASQALESIQAQIDGIDITTSKSIDKLEADKAATKDLEKQALIQQEINRLENRRESSVNKLRAMNDKVTKGIEKQLSLSNSMEKTAFFTGSTEAVKTRFKGTRQEGDANMLLAKTAQMGQSVLRAKIEATVSSGQFGPAQASGFINLFADDKEALNRTFNAFLNVQGLEDLNKLQSILGGFKDQALAKDIMVKMSGLSDKEFQAQYSTLELLQQMNGEEINIEVALKQDPNLLTNVTKLNSAVEAIAMIPDTTFKTVELVLKNVVLEGTDKTFSQEGLNGLSKNWEYYKGLDPVLRKTAIQTYVSLFSTIFTNKDARLQWASNLAETASAGIGNQQARDQIRTITYNTVIKSDGSFTEQGKKTVVEDVQKQTEDIIGYMAAITKLTNAGKGGGPAGTRNTFLDNILDKIRRVRDASANIVSDNPLEELRRLIAKGNGQITIFDGLDQQISNLKAPQEFIDFIASLDPKGKKGTIDALETYLDTEQLSKGIVKLTKEGKLLLGIFKEGVIGDFESDLRKATNGLIAQKDQFILLNLVVKDNKLSAEMLADANFALALSLATTAAEVDVLVAAFKAQKAAQEDLAKTQNPLEYLQNEFSKVEDQVNKFFSLAQQDIEGRYARRIFNAEQEVKAAAKRVETAQKNVADVQKDIDNIQASIDEKQREIQENVTRPIEDFQEQIADIEDIIKTNFDKPISILQEESSDLANDLTLLDRAADEINKKYDAQEEALTKISEINKDLIAQEKQRISLADALTSGDISVAAQAVQDMRQSAAEKASSSNRNLLNAAKEKELNQQRTAAGLTRIQIEERQFKIGQEIFKLEEGREKLEKNIALIKTRDIEPLEKRRKSILALIRLDEDAIFQITKEKLIPAKAKLDLEIAELEKLEAKLKIIEEERAAELTHLDSLKLKWTEVKGNIALAELATISLQAQITEAIRLAGLLAAEFLKIVVPGGGVLNPGETPQQKAEREKREKEAAEAARLAEIERQRLAAAAEAARLAEIERQRLAAAAAEKAAAEKAAADAAAAAAKAAAEKAEKAAADAAAAATTAAEKAAAEKAALAAAAAAAAAEKAAADAAAAAEKAAAEAAANTADAARAEALRREAARLAAEIAAANAISDAIEKARRENEEKLAKLERDKAAAAIAAANAISDAIEKARRENEQKLAKSERDKKALEESGADAARAEALRREAARLAAVATKNVVGGSGLFIQTRSSGGMIMPKYFAAGGFSRGTDTVPAMLTPGEFVMSKYAVSNYGVDKMKAMNTGTYQGEKVYNYNLSVNVKSDANPDDIARVVITQIKQIDSQRIRTQRQ